MANIGTDAVALLRYLSQHPVGARRPVRALANFISWQIRSRLNPGSHVEPWVAGSRLVVQRGMVGATGNLYFGLHEFSDMGLLLHLLKPGDLFLDVGANVGTYTVLAGAVREARCLSFEPDPETATKLRANLAANAIADRVTIHETALGASDGEIAFTVGLDTINRVASAEEPHRIVPMARLDSLIGDIEPVLMKVDVEGHEDAMFAGAQQVLQKPSLLAIMTESAGPETLASFARFGFERRFYNPWTRSLSADPNPWHDNNMLFVRNIDAIMDRVAATPAIKLFGLRL
ncbi:FkbM family methyltransferase [Sphingomonas sp.]|uniref:FkbM family methyltransferase n=1 Tax=Sphingomonas sp. TaxID=28214 RepID=UPI003BA9FE7F